jgi:non-specific serine/threonine protein kinase/serine/threonine-protein kinase
MGLTRSDDNLSKKNPEQDRDSDIKDLTKSADSSSSSTKLDSHHPQKIGQYLIKRVIASGGMGTVFEAIQENPRRSVAIKVVKGSDVSERAVQRLKYEAQMLARLRHPGIAEIYEAGMYEEHGTTAPFFAMEYISNAKTVTEYADSRKLSVNERLELFVQVCDAVNYGHQRGIVHRDLKPDNILVDSHNRVRIIDFGLARATDSDLRQTNLHTEIGQIIGSLQYMSPEQFEADSRDLDTRSDVYSLGVVLYELLSGMLPFDLRGKKVYEIAGIVREKQPSSLSKIGTRAPAEVDVIVQKCLSKEREMRYQTAYGLRQDIVRFLSGDAIVARSPSLTYQLKVFARKNKMLVSSFATALLLLVSGIIASTTLLLQVSEESEKARKANNFLASIFETAVPIGFGEPVPISRLLDKSTKMLEGAFPEDPDIEGDISHSLGVGYFFCEEYNEAREYLNHALSLRRQSLGATHPKTKETLEQLSLLNNVTGEYQEDLVVCEEICRIDSINYGIKNESTLSSKLDVAFGLESVGRIADALKVVKNTRELYLNENSDNIKLGNQIDRFLSWFLLQSGSFSEAEEIAKKNLELATSRIETSWHTESSKSYLAATLVAQGELAEAAELYGDFPTYPALDKESDIQGDLDPDECDVLLIVFWEAWCPFCDTKMEKLERLYRQYHNYGIDMVGVTRITKTSTRQDCEEFIRRNNITFPIFKESGQAFKYFNISGVPSVRLVYKGKLIWDHKVASTQLISRHMLEGIVKALKSSVVSEEPS